MESIDYRPLFKQYMRYGYMEEKAKRFKKCRQTISNVLAGKHRNPTILEECLKELNERIERRTASLKKVNELTEIHRQLQPQYYEQVKNITHVTRRKEGHVFGIDL